MAGIATATSESIVLDLDRPEGRDALIGLAKTAQIVIEDERPTDPRGVRAALRASRTGTTAFTLASITPFVEAYNNNLAGWAAIFDVQINSPFNLCDAAF